MLILFLDESGDHSLNKIDTQYPVFVLGGCIVDGGYHDSQMTEEVQRYKRDLFGRDDFIIHTADIARRRGVFRALTNKDLRETFYEKTNQLMKRCDYMVVAKVTHSLLYASTIHKNYALVHFLVCISLPAVS